ncbi:hypothetical protein [Variovorax boronicumulans]|uniref:hypothetical protein n=1 Tax=Variovorax boronicumulans TaxID=436515 RepID=UPI0027D82826|nr:hypothetical protein [Variovorax boronicumulans]
MMLPTRQGPLEPAATAAKSSAPLRRKKELVVAEGRLNCEPYDKPEPVTKLIDRPNRLVRLTRAWTSPLSSETKVHTARSWRNNPNEEKLIRKTSVTYAALVEWEGPIRAVFERMETMDLWGAYLDFAYLKAMDRFEHLQIGFLPNLIAGMVRFGPDQGDLEVFKSDLSDEHMRKIVFKQLGPTIEVPVLKQG